jgi:hypothetical protein
VRLHPRAGGVAAQGCVSVVWMVALADQNADRSIDGRQLGEPGQAEVPGSGRRVRVEPDRRQRGPLHRLRDVPVAEGELQVGGEVDERAGCTGVEHDPALRGEAGVEQGQRHPQRRGRGIVVPVGERSQDDREPVLTDRQLQAAIGANGCLQFADEGTQQLTDRKLIPIDAGGGEVAKAGQETSWNLQQ